MTLCRPDLLCCYYSREVFQIRRPAQAVVPGYEGRHFVLSSICSSILHIPISCLFVVFLDKSVEKLLLTH